MKKWMNERLNLLYGEKNVAYLSSCTVLVVGLGGVGGYAVEALARCGVGKLILIDYDSITFSNLNRQIIALTTTIGKKKTDCFEERIRLINPNCQVIPISIKVTNDTVEECFHEKVDFVFDACDSTEAKLALAKITQAKKIPFLMALGVGNRRYGTEVTQSTLEKTSGDPLARKMRYLFKKEGLSMKIPVIYSKETPKIQTSKIIASSIFVPAVSGLTAANYIIEYLLHSKNR